jgi:hypothetical protein
MRSPVEEMRDICGKLLPEQQKTLLKYAREAYAEENAGKIAVKKASEQEPETTRDENIPVR